MSTLRILTGVRVSRHAICYGQLRTAALVNVDVFFQSGYGPSDHNRHYSRHYTSCAKYTRNHIDDRLCSYSTFRVWSAATPLTNALRKFSWPTGIGNRCYFGTKPSTPPTKPASKTDTKSAASLANADLLGATSNLTLFQKFKLMYKKYWYVLIPVHVITSIGWFGGFYYMSKCGVDIPALLHSIHISESIIEKMQRSDMGHFAIAYLCYKAATPLRYAVTLGGTTVSIKYFVQAGHIKPMPSKQEIIKMYENKKATRAATKDGTVTKKPETPPSTK